MLRSDAATKKERGWPVSLDITPNTPATTITLPGSYSAQHAERVLLIVGGVWMRQETKGTRKEISIMGLMT